MAKAIVVTGAAGALGRAVVDLLAGQGHAVVGLYRADQPLQAGTAQYIGGIDLTDSTSVETAFARIGEEHSALAGLVNIAGAFRWEMLEQGGIDTWARLFDINLRTAVNCAKAALPLLRKGGGAIVNIGAASALKAGAGMGAYAASKAGVAKLTESLAEEEKDRGVRVNAVLPSIIDTPANRADMPDADASRWVTPEQLAEVIAFLLSDRASAITGACIPVTGRC